MGKHSYAVVFDAGSSGTRVYVYRWRKAESARKKYDKEDLHNLPKIKTDKDWRRKVKPGISTFGPIPEDVGPDHLKDLVDFATKIVDKDEIENTPIFLLATAGMRLLPGHQREAVLSHTCSYFRQNTRFQLPDCNLHVQVIPGETEGLYGWIAANYLLGGFDEPEKHAHGKDHHTYGFLDMGGASAQIAFAPNATEAEKHANDLKLLRLRSVNGEAQEFRVFVTTWLGFGANEARRRFVEKLVAQYTPTPAHEIPDPCLPAGIMTKLTGEEIDNGANEIKAGNSYLMGTGQFMECLASTKPLLEKEKACTDAPCLLNGQHTPAIDFGVNHFVGVSEYWHTTHEVFAMAHKDKAYDFQTYQKQVIDLCSRKWSDIQKDVAKEKWGNKVDAKTVEEVCFKASWLINMLHDGIGVPRLGIETGTGGKGNKTNDIVDGAKDHGFLDPFQAVDKIDGNEVSWTLGKAVLYAASQMPPAKGAMAVGFGSNIKGSELPSDFQYPGGGRIEPLPPVDNNTSPTPSRPDESSKDWHDRILSGNYSRRVPGILIFFLILALAVYLLCGRERRLSLWHKFFGGGGKGGRPSAGRPKPRRGPNFLGSKFFGGGSTASPTYERVMEDGGDPHDDFELADVSSDDERSDSSSGHHAASIDAIRSGRTSGMVTPATRGLSPDMHRDSPKQRAYFDSPGGGGGGGGSGGGGIGHGLGITPFERGGLTVRSESKDRVGGRSRRASPTRVGKSPLITPFKESVD